MSTEITVFRHEASFNEADDKWTFACKEVPCIEMQRQNGWYNTLDNEPIKKSQHWFSASMLYKAWEEKGSIFVLTLESDPEKAIRAFRVKLMKDFDKAFEALEVVKATHARLGNRLERIKNK
jgi:hypothetical protein